MSRSLSLVLPIANVEKTLAENMQNLFELLNDLTDKFEIILVDQGSTDHTIDVARELAILYPQVRVAQRDEIDQGEVSMDKTLAETTGDIVFVQTGHAGLRPSALRQLWSQNEHGTRPSTRLSRVGRLPEPPLLTENNSIGGSLHGLKVIQRSATASRLESHPTGV